MNTGSVRWAIFNIQSESAEDRLRVDILTDSRVRLRLTSPAGTRDLLCDTLEDRALLAAAEPALSGELYEGLL